MRLITKAERNSTPCSRLAVNTSLYTLRRHPCLRRSRTGGTVSFGLLSKVLFSVILFGFIFSSQSMAAGMLEEAEAEPERGPHRGRLLRQENFALELTIFETGVPPEFRVYAFENDNPVAPENVVLDIVLTRLGEVRDQIQFASEEDFLRGDQVIYEPHSFVVTVNASYQGENYQWEYDNFEGRTRIEEKVAEALEIDTSIAGPALLKEVVAVYGKIKTHPEAIREISARFEGEIKTVHVALLARVKQGQPLITIESNESLNSYTINAPIDGVIRERNANPYEQTRNRVLFTLVGDAAIAELSVFPSDIKKVAVGNPVTLYNNVGDQPVMGRVFLVKDEVMPSQATMVSVEIIDTNTMVLPGSFVKAEIEVGQYEVPLAVKRTGLQAFRDFTVVYTKIGDQYEVRMLELGREAGDWVEVLGGLAPGAEYVSENSYVIKADIEKSGASHDH